MESHTQVNKKTAHAYNTAADLFDHPANTFWSRFGTSTVDRLGLIKGDKVLDVCSGTGASALPAARKVGSDGRVVAVDLAEKLLARAAEKASAEGLQNIQFRVGDMFALAYPDGYFDAVICVFGIFFMPDMATAVRELWRQVRPGGRLAITTWGPELFEPANTSLWQAIRHQRPDLYKDFNPWDRISTPEGLLEMLASAGLTEVDIFAEDATHALSEPEDWWILAMGSGYRGTLEQLNGEELQKVKQANLHHLASQSVTEISANVIYAIVNKPLV
ncbi:class I SAM-dependent methyltransferase (plasmid) [Methylomonas sp. LL1]|uniref:class I SAM-dependent methyltransferase n=2 Tax=Methylomonas TaxID=416 RepID=UPI0018C4052D|nr:class I SAM-dependent methyltransferase [Methylomonas sp. LL1]QPK61440.1 class I SAM-dependent methyltransferase [Methylomonas sp. LL1]